jgi:hypothetical protein
MVDIKVDATLLYMASVPRKQEHLRSFIEGKTSFVDNLTIEEEEEESSKNKIMVVYNPRNSIRNPPFYVSMKIMDKIVIIVKLTMVQGRMSCLELSWKNWDFHALMRNIITCWLILIKNKPPSENSRM